MAREGGGQSPRTRIRFNEILFPRGYTYNSKIRVHVSGPTSVAHCRSRAGRVPHPSLGWGGVGRGGRGLGVRSEEGVEPSSAGRAFTLSLLLYVTLLPRTAWTCN